MLSEAAKAARRAYMREYRRKNREKVDAKIERFWERKAVEMGFTDGEPVNPADSSKGNDE